MITLHDFDATGARFADSAGTLHALSTPDLLALAEEGRDPRSLQRVPGFLRPHGALLACEAGAKFWQLRFADGSRATLAVASLARMLEPVAAQVPRQAWRNDTPPPQSHDYHAVLHDPAARLACLRQVLSHGYTRLTDVPTMPGTVETFLASFGPVRETNYGRLFDVKVQPDPANLADSALALLPHTDNPYRVTPPDLQLLHALDTPDEGGETWLVDGLALVEHLRTEAPQAFALLTTVPVRFAWQSADWRLATVEPVIALAPDGSLLRLRINSRSLDRPVEADAARRAAWWAAWEQLEACLADPAFAQTFALRSGEMVLMDNRRLLHGRSAFTAHGARHLQGAYADIDGLTSQVSVLAEGLAGQAVARVEELFLAPVMAGTYGEAITIRDHMLQAAEIAARQGLGEEAVAAALLHDIGWTMAAPHETSGADWLEPMFGAGVAGPVRHHVAAKRYLVARQPAYRDRLSEASIATLQQQGGPMDEEECAAFEAMQGHDIALAVRHADDAGKETPPPQTSWADYTPLLHRLALRHLLTA
ncbi:TauD/TfdA family dioxygenase [Novosphingobium terrae]|uniref:TauD/TfdA family dioxygenase n=1 Tax=Novosphingobium terrae TaxID=2726189 RepID=UPI0019807DB7|nr:TauD/TfdA family dioxygenase [Novosphingobium terrae]